MFSRKSRSEPAAATKRSANPNDKARFPSRFRSVCPDTDNRWKPLYEVPANALKASLQDIDAGTGDLSRYEWQMEVATEAMTMIDKRPLQALVALHGDNTYDFHRAVYLRGLVAGLGEYFRQGSLMSSATKSFNPALTGWPEGRVKWVKDRPIKPEFRIGAGICEYRIADQIGAIELAEKLDPGVFGYFCDSFDTRASTKNPILVSLGEAENKVSRVLALNGVYADSIPKLTAGASSENESTTEAVEPEPEKAEPVPPVIQESPIPAVDNQPKAATPVVKTSSVSGEDILNLMVDRMPQGVVTVNENDSMICEVEGSVALVFPRAVRMLSEMLEKPEEMVESIIVRDLVNETDSHPVVDYRIQRKGRGWGKIRLKKLHPEPATRLIEAMGKRKPAPEIKRR